MVPAVAPLGAPNVTVASPAFWKFSVFPSASVDAASGTWICTFHVFGTSCPLALTACVQLRVTEWAVPSESYTVICDERGDAVVAVPFAGVAGRLAARVTFWVAIGL